MVGCALWVKGYKNSEFEMAHWLEAVIKQYCFGCFFISTATEKFC
jgi:hypothetical protein